MFFASSFVVIRSQSTAGVNTMDRGKRMTGISSDVYRIKYLTGRMAKKRMTTREQPRDKVAEKHDDFRGRLK